MDLTFEPAPPDVLVLADGIQCGFIDAPTLAFQGWRIRLMVAQRPTTIDPLPYRWLTLRRVFDTEEQARVALVSMWPALQRQYEIWREA